MRMLPLFAIVYCVGVLLITASAPQGPWSPGQTTWINLGGALLVAVYGVALLITGIRRVPETYRFAVFASLVLVGAAGLYFRGDIKDTLLSNLNRYMPVAAVADTANSANLPRRWDGHFRADAQINDGEVEMLVDTGASIVLLTFEDALAVGVDMGALAFNMAILTANGEGRVAMVTLDRVSIGGVTVDGVEAAVAEPGALHASLLGMSFLGAIDEAIIRRDRLILRN